MRSLLFLTGALLAGCTSSAPPATAPATTPSSVTTTATPSQEGPVINFTVDKLAGGTANLADYRGKVLLIVNTASECGFTPQYKGLEALYEKLHSRGLEVLGFPCNQFGAQEPGTAEEIESF